MDVLAHFQKDVMFIKLSIFSKIAKMRQVQYSIMGTVASMDPTVLYDRSHGKTLQHWFSTTHHTGMKSCKYDTDVRQQFIVVPFSQNVFVRGPTNPATCWFLDLLKHKNVECDSIVCY